MNMHLSASQHALIVTLCLALTAPAWAQQQPITGRMMDGQAQTSAATAAPAARQSAAPAVAPARDVPPPPPPSGQPSAVAQQDIGNPSRPVAYAGIDSDGIGSTTRELLHMQVSGSHAGQRLPMLGDEASASYKRYIQSFNHPIPEFFETTVGKNGNSGR